MIKNQLNEETYADAARRVGIKGQLDNELIGYMEDLFQLIDDLESYPLERNFPNNKVAVKQCRQAFALLKSTQFGQLFK